MSQEVLTQEVLKLIERYGSRGVLVDSNILLLHFVGGLDRKLVPHHKRTNQFAVEDYDLLESFLSKFQRIVTTPNILTEVNSLLGQIGEPRRTDCQAVLGRGIGLLDEHYVPSADVVLDDHFVKLGLTDSVIARLAEGSYLVLTDDVKLASLLQQIPVDVVNFNHLRPLSWS